MLKKLNESPINYFSDLFVVAMVVSWIVVQIIMVASAIYATIVLEVTDVWGYVWELTGIPLTAGGAIWMIKNTVQHNIANKQGRECPKDFPAVNDSVEIDEQEKPMEFDDTDSTEEVKTDSGDADDETENFG